MAISSEGMAELDSEELEQVLRLESGIDQELRRRYGVMATASLQFDSETVKSFRVKEELARRYRGVGWEVTIVERNEGTAVKFNFCHKEKKASFHF